MKVAVLTLGCRVNQSESDVIEGNLKKFGWSIVGLSEYPDYCIVKTCTVTAKSDYQSRQLIRRAVRSGTKVIGTGCYSQLRPDEIRKIGGVVDIIDNNNKLNIIKMLSDDNSSVTFGYSNKSRPCLKIQEGCNLACTYCTVPMARGRSRSLKVSEALKRAEEIEANGYNEIVLTGINLGSYGHDLRPKVNLSYFLKTLLKKTKNFRIRLSSIEIRRVDDELIELLQEQRICSHIHLPLQSGDNTILRRMNRMYTSEEYLSTIGSITKRVPKIAIGTDVIVGFPGEGDKEFLNTKNLLDSIPIAYMHIFPFSPRPKTLASKMLPQNASSINGERLSELKALNFRKKKAYMSSQINKTLDVITEEQYADDISIGTSSNYLKVKVLTNGHPKGSLISVRVSEIEGDFVKADLIKKL